MRRLATIQRIAEIRSIDGADRIVKARINGWWVVTAIDNGFQVGDLVVYFEIDSFLPDLPVFEFLKKGATLKRMTVDDKVVVGIRLKTIKLRGTISQGLIMPLHEMQKIAITKFDGTLEDTDISDNLGVLKYEQPIPSQLAGKVKGFFPSFIPRTDEERIQNMDGVLSGFYVTEKLDGSSVTYFKKEGVLRVCSRNLELSEGENTHWRLGREMELESKIPEGIALQGELVGFGIQGNPYNLQTHKVYFYNAYNITSGEYLNFYEFKNLITALGLQTVPIIDEHFPLPNNVDAMLSYAEGKSALFDTEREGVVVRSKSALSYKGSRLSFKAISNKFLLKEQD